MKTQDIFIAHPKTEEQINALKAMAKALKMKFELSKEDPYDPEFVSKIQKSRREMEEGDFTQVEKEDLEEFLGLK